MDVHAVSNRSIFQTVIFCCDQVVPVEGVVQCAGGLGYFQSIRSHALSVVARVDEQLHAVVHIQSTAAYGFAEKLCSSVNTV